MIDYLTYYYRMDQEPFQSLSALTDQEAIKIMEELCDDTPYGERFKDPIQYLKNRKDTEQWVRKAFLAKGGRPKDEFPISMVLGSSKWLEKASPDPKQHGEIRIPLSIFTFEDVSFTYPDSMLSRWFGQDKPAEFYQAEFHGIIFTLPEIFLIVEKNGMPEEDWEIKLPERLAPYIEAQVWNRGILLDYWKRIRT